LRGGAVGATRKHKVVRRRRAEKIVSEQEAVQASVRAEKEWELRPQLDRRAASSHGVKVREAAEEV